MASEVQQLMNTIETEVQAMILGMHGFAQTAKFQHDTTSVAYDRVGLATTALGNLIGQDAALEIMCATYEKVMEQVPSKPS